MITVARACDECHERKLRSGDSQSCYRSKIFMIPYEDAQFEVLNGCNYASCGLVCDE